MRNKILFCLFTGFFHFTFASNRLRIFSMNDTNKRQSADALKECNQRNASLVTLYDEEDAKFTATFTANLADYGSNVWLGLRKGRNITWSDGARISLNESSVTVTNGKQICEAIENSTWRGFNCSERKPFMCYKGKFEHI